MKATKQNTKNAAEAKSRCEMRALAEHDFKADQLNVENLSEAMWDRDSKIAGMWMRVAASMLMRSSATLARPGVEFETFEKMMDGLHETRTRFEGLVEILKSAQARGFIVMAKIGVRDEAA